MRAYQRKKSIIQPKSCSRGVGETRMSIANNVPESAGISLPQPGTAICPYASSVYYQVGVVLIGSSEIIRWQKCII